MLVFDTVSINLRPTFFIALKLAKNHKSSNKSFQFLHFDSWSNFRGNGMWYQMFGMNLVEQESDKIKISFRLLDTHLVYKMWFRFNQTGIFKLFKAWKLWEPKITFTFALKIYTIQKWTSTRCQIFIWWRSYDQNKISVQTLWVLINLLAEIFWWSTRSN